MRNPEMLLQAAEQVVRILEKLQVDAVIIGAVAMAAHHYVRLTHDIDLAVNADIQQLRDIAAALHAAGYKADLREPDDSDPLGGVIDVTGSFGMLQIISFADRFPAVIEDALRTTTMRLRAGSSLKFVPLAQLVALKLYAGGLKSKADIFELLTRNPDADLDEIRDACECYHLDGLDEVLREIHPPRR